MTIAACYLSVDGVVFGADSTTTMFVQGLGPNPVGGEHHYNYAQKIFQIGKESTLAMTMWGLGNLNNISYRTLIALFGDELAKTPATSLDEVAARWNVFFWNAYSTEYAPQFKEGPRLTRHLHSDPRRRLGIGIFGEYVVRRILPGRQFVP